MGVYAVEINGKLRHIQADSKPTEEEVNSLLDHEEAQKSISMSTAVAGLPGRMMDAASRMKASDAPGVASDILRGLSDPITQPVNAALAHPEAFNPANGLNTPIIQGMAASQATPLPPLPDYLPHPESEGGKTVGEALRASAPILAAELPAMVKNNPTSGGVHPDRINPLAGKSQEELQEMVEAEKAQLEGKVQTADHQLQARQTMIKNVKENSVPTTARQVVLQARDPNYHGPAFQKEYDKFKAGLKFGYDGVRLPDEDAQAFLRRLGRQEGIIGADGNVLQNVPIKPDQEGLVNALEKYGVSKKAIPGLPDRAATAMDQDFLRGLRSGKLGEQVESQLGVPVNKAPGPSSVPSSKSHLLSDVIDDLSMDKNSVSGGTGSGRLDRIVNKAHAQLLDFLDSNADRLGVSPKQIEVLKQIRRDYRPFAEFKNWFYDKIDPYNDVAALDTNAGRKLFEKYGRGEVLPGSDEEEVIRRYKKYVDPNFDAGLKTHITDIKNLEGQAQQFQLMKTSHQMHLKEVGDIGELGDAIKTVKDQNARKRMISNQFGYFARYLARRLGGNFIFDSFK